jgi:hypothetical protein
LVIPAGTEDTPISLIIPGELLTLSLGSDSDFQTSLRIQSGKASDDLGDPQIVEADPVIEVTHRLELVGSVEVSGIIIGPDAELYLIQESTTAEFPIFVLGSITSNSRGLANFGAGSIHIEMTKALEVDSVVLITGEVEGNCAQLENAVAEGGGWDELGYELVCGTSLVLKKKVVPSPEGWWPPDVWVIIVVVLAVVIVIVVGVILCACFCKPAHKQVLPEEDAFQVPE